MSSFDRNVSTPEINKNTDECNFDANASNNNNINIYEQSSKEEDFSENEEFSEVEEASEEYSCAIEECNTPSQGISYASMASKPIIELPKFLNIDLGTKEVEVKFELWHMITKLASNHYYCIACNTKDHIRFKSRHCNTCEHVEKLAKCTIVTAFRDYLIRKVDDKLYHCGHCNCLQYFDQMEDHIKSCHPKMNRNYIETRNPRNTNKKTKTTEKVCSKNVIETKETESNKRAIINKNLDYEPNIDPPKSDADFNVFGDMPITPFECMLKIPVLNFNFIMKRDEDYYCAICDKVGVDAKVHVDEFEHVQFMTWTPPFIKLFTNNLTRFVRGLLHCSICNKLFPICDLYHHNISQQHITALATAMGMIKSQKPIRAQRVTMLNLDNGQNSQNITNDGLKNSGRSVLGPQYNDHFIKSTGNDDLYKVETENESEDEYQEFDEEEMVILKLKTTYFKISNMSYNTLLFVTNGMRFCFLCSSMVSTSQEQRHVEIWKHIDNLAEKTFLDIGGVQLIREMYQLYHCAICNERMAKNEIKLHLESPMHVERYEAANLILNKKNRKELISGLKQYVVAMQKEPHNVLEPNYHLQVTYPIAPNLKFLQTNFQTSNNKDALDSRPDGGPKCNVVKKKKLLIQNNEVMKISFDQWHAIMSTKRITKCIICQVVIITPDEVFKHVEQPYHAVGLRNFNMTYYPELIRKINESIVNCITCNMELANVDDMILEHIMGSRHYQNKKTILSDPSHSNSYADCSEDYIYM